VALGVATCRCGPVKAAARVDVDPRDPMAAERAGSVELAAARCSTRRAIGRSSAIGRQSTTCGARGPTIAPARRPGRHSMRIHPREAAGVLVWPHCHVARRAPGHMTMRPPSSAVDRASATCCEVLVVATCRCGPLKRDDPRPSMSTPIGSRPQVRPWSVTFSSADSSTAVGPRQGDAIEHSDTAIPYRCINWPGTACLRHLTGIIARDLAS